MTTKITPLKAEFAKIDGLRERIALRAADLMRQLGESGSDKLAKPELKALLWHMDTRRPATAATHAEFVALEADMRKRYGNARMQSVATDGLHLEGKDRRVKRPNVTTKAAKPALLQKPAFTGNVVELRPRRVGSGNGPNRAA